MKLLNIVSSGYRATIEEQDDTIVWLTHALRNAGADVDILLTGAAANYPVRGQTVEPVNIGGVAQKHAPDVHGQVRELCAKGASVYVVREELEERAVKNSELLAEIALVGRAELPALLSGYDQVWHW
jgi:predicted peroxiredoxin